MYMAGREHRGKQKRYVLAMHRVLGTYMSGAIIEDLLVKYEVDVTSESDSADEILT